jgi:hypothetical protein
LRAHTLSISCHCWEYRRKACFRIYRSLEVAFDLMSTMVRKRPHCREQRKVTGSEIRRVRWLGDDTTSDVWLGAETTVPACHLSSRFLRTASHNLCKSGMYKWPVTHCPGGTNSWCTKPSTSKNSRNFLTAPRMKSKILKTL